MVIDLTKSLIKPEVSIIICTYRRPDVIEAVVKSLIKQSLDPNKFEIIIVDNNSMDNTYDMVKPYIQYSSPKIKYILEKKQGLSYARNTGVAFSQSDLVAFIDDDAIADPNWLADIVNVYLNYPEAVAVGGKIIPQWEDNRPAWFKDSMLGYLSVVDWGDLIKELIWPERLLGTNISFKKKMLTDYGGFDINLGRRGHSLMGAEETMVQKTFMEEGLPVIYTPKAIIYHRISPDRISYSYLTRLAYGNGKTDAYLQKHGDSKKIFINKIKYSLRLLINYCGFFRVKDERKTKFEIKLNLAYNFGYLNQQIRQILNKRRKT